MGESFEDASPEFAAPWMTSDLMGLRRHLLGSPHHSLESLARLRGASAGVTSHDVTKAGLAVLAVDVDGELVLPTFQFDECGELLAASVAVVRVLQEAGVVGWQLWEWLVSPTGWLDGASVGEVLAIDPDAALVAVRAFVTELSSSRDSRVV